MVLDDLQDILKKSWGDCSTKVMAFGDLGRDFKQKGNNIETNFCFIFNKFSRVFYYFEHFYIFTFFIKIFPLINKC